MVVLRDPKVRALIAILVALLGLGLALHQAGEHSVMAEACLAVLAVLALALLFPGRPGRPVSLRTSSSRVETRGSVVPVIGRHPPADGTVLLL